ncbi:macrolide family glycosyltransferase [Streptomyces albogriseolus]|uniref:macrolide family glycosyltransferase n=1 Tax=Streptomyces TaxID=1883 RepID=UPI00224CE500|nr:macrolide family glycosyltransferase [Streptomyces viridodiastaticus]MCX4565092.1 oleandomycin glycosyltransferase [Streptomyces viridodiastaticus]
MSTVAFVNVALRGHINPTLPVVAELVRRGHTVTYHTTAAFEPDVAAAGATVHRYPGDGPPLAGPPTPVTLLEQLARTALETLPAVLADLRRARPDVVVHGAACPWGPVTAAELGVPAVSLFTTMAFGRRVPSPARASWTLLAEAVTRPRSLLGYVRARLLLARRHRTRGLPLVDLVNARQPLNLVFTSRAFQPEAASFDRTYRFVGPSVGARPHDPSFPFGLLRPPVLYVSLGTVFDAGPSALRAFAAALAPLGGTVVVATGHTDPAALGALPDNVLARRFVPQPELLERAALFVTHGGMNSVNEALYAGVPVLVVPQGADQPQVARRVTELGAGLTVRPEAATEAAVHALARRLLTEPRFREAAGALRTAQRQAGGHLRAADEIEALLRRTGPHEKREH